MIDPTDIAHYNLKTLRKNSDFTIIPETENWVTSSSRNRQTHRNEISENTEAGAEGGKTLGSKLWLSRVREEISKGWIERKTEENI